MVILTAGSRVTQEIVEALGIDGDNIESINIDIRSGDNIKVTVVKFPTAQEIKNIAMILKDNDLV